MPALALVAVVVCIRLIPWQLLSEVLGMSLPGSSSHPAESADKKEDIEAAGRAVVKMLELGLKPSDILTREALKMPSL